MDIRKYGVKTRSGSWYYIERQKPLVGNANWFIEIEGEVSYIFGLQNGDAGDKNNILGAKIRKIEDFLTRTVKFSSDLDKIGMVWGPGIANTSRVVEVAVFK